MKKVYVTGCAGFLGSFLSQELLKNGYRVYGCDNFFRGKKEYLPDNKNFTFHNVDLVNEDEAFENIIREVKPDIMIHYAAINGTEYFYDIPYQVTNDNVKMTQNVLNAIKNSNVKKIVYASSSEVYGEPMQVPTPESHPILLNVHTDRDSYASSKAINEFYVKLFAQENNLDYLILRIFNTYGPHMDTSKYGQVVPEFIKKLFEDEKFTIIGNGQHTRSFCYVDDHTRLALNLIENVKDEIINLGNDKETSIDQLAETIHKLENKRFEPKYLPGREYDHKRRCPDITKLKSLLNDSPKISLREGIMKTIEVYKK